VDHKWVRVLASFHLSLFSAMNFSRLFEGENDDEQQNSDDPNPSLGLAEWPSVVILRA
jgi:hypothetical protein